MEDETLLRLHILPRLGTTKVSGVIRQDISKLHQSMEDRPGAANRTVSLLSKMFNLAEKWGWRVDGSNPCRHIYKYRENKKERFLSSEELVQLGNVLLDAERTGSESPSVIAAIRLLLMTGCRLSEIITLRWSDVDYERRLLRIRESKTGAKTVVLSDAAYEIFRKIEKVPDNPYVIIGERDRAHLVNLRKPWYRIRARAGLNDVRIHDLRHTFASFAAESGISLPIIGALLGHSQPTTARYAHIANDPLIKASQRTGSHGSHPSGRDVGLGTKR